MLARIRQRQEEDGFTLIELLVVMIIIGILAAIAIPIFLNQRKSAQDSAIKSDLRSTATEVESYYVTNQTYPAAATDLTAGTVQTSPGVNIAYYVDGDGYCLLGTNVNGDASQPWVYESAGGGLQDKATQTCGGTDSGSWGA